MKPVQFCKDFIFKFFSTSCNSKIEPSHEFLEVYFLNMNTVNVLKFRTLKIIIFSAVRNFRNYVSEKVLVLVI